MNLVMWKTWNYISHVVKVVYFVCCEAPHYTKAPQSCILTLETVTDSKQDEIVSEAVRNLTEIYVTYTIGLLEDGAWVITVLDVGDGIACWIITLESELVSSTLGTCSDAGRTIVDVGCAVCCSDTSWGKNKDQCVCKIQLLIGNSRKQ